MEQLSPCAPTTKAHMPRGCALQKEKPLQWDTFILQLESSPHSLQVGKAHMQQEDPVQAKKIKINNNKKLHIGKK